MKILMTIILSIALLVPHFCFSQKPRKDISGDYLLQTKWDGTKPFNIYAPNNHTLGCHSVALAQILFFHKLAPSGNVKYVCSNRIQVNEDISGYAPSWELIARVITDSTKQESIDETAKYMYYVASIVKKDFGTDNYIPCNDYHKSEVESHFNCLYHPYAKEINSNLAGILKGDDGFYAIIKREIDSERPVGLYYTNKKVIGHAVVIDGYIVKNETIFVHANFGWGGKADGWYLLNEDLPKDIKLLLLITVLPK